MFAPETNQWTTRAAEFRHVERNGRGRKTNGELVKNKQTYYIQLPALGRVRTRERKYLNINTVAQVYYFYRTLRCIFFQDNQTG